MIFDPTRIRFLIMIGQLIDLKEKFLYFAVFQTKVRYASHRRRLSFRQVLVHLVDTIRYMVVRLVKQLASSSVKGSSHQ